ncbi:hypothetical protein AB0G32_28530 [Streptomyces sp. NPDC023723]|uniref:hypothetical protein n=1 Tax=Streptomyces sp. NPDC023723 TaxID=3154323 RepID=UPI0034077F69
MPTETRWDHWPLVEVHGETASKAEHHAAVLDALRIALDRVEPFALVVVQPTVAKDEPMRAPKSGLVRFLRTHRAQMGERCRGVAIVADPSVLRRAGRLVKAAPLILGCPAAAFDRAAAARDWADGRLRPRTTEAGGGPC